MEAMKEKSTNKCRICSVEDEMALHILGASTVRWNNLNMKRDMIKLPPGPSYSKPDLINPGDLVGILFSVY